MRKFRTPVWLCLHAWIAHASLVAQGHPPAQLILEGQEALYRLQYDRAGQIFLKARNDYPNSPVGCGMLSILAWDRLLFESSNFALDDYSTPSPFVKARTRKPIGPATQRFHDANDALVAKCHELLKRNPNDVLALYFQGLAAENLAAEAIVIQKKNNLAFRHGKKAKETHERVLELEPRLVDANVSLAAYDYAAANLKWYLKFFAIFLGIRGDEQRAFRRLQQVADRGEYRRYDALLLLGLMKAWKGKREYAAEAVDVFESLRRKFPENFLLDLNLAAMYEKTDLRAALKLYENLLQSLASKTPGLQPGEVWWRVGRCNYRLRNYDRALEAFGKTLAAPRSEKETAPLAQYYGGLIHDAQGDRVRAIESFRAVVKDQSLTTISKEMGDARRRLKKLRGS